MEIDNFASLITPEEHHSYLQDTQINPQRLQLQNLSIRGRNLSWVKEQKINPNIFVQKPTELPPLLK